MLFCQSTRATMPDPSRVGDSPAFHLHRCQIAIGIGLAASFALILILADSLQRDPSNWNPHGGSLLTFLLLILVFVLIEVIGIVASTFVLWRHPELRNPRSLCTLALGIVGMSAFVFIAAHPPGYFLG